MVRLLLVQILFLVVIFAPDSEAVLIAGSDGSINTTAPDPDPGFSNVGDMAGLTGVYVRNGWVLTANHVGIGPIRLAGVLYDPIPGSEVRFSSSDPPTAPNADLIAFKLEERPPLPDLVLVSTPPSYLDRVVMIGNSQLRGDATSWMGFDGWLHGGVREIRWGTNRIDYTNEFDGNRNTYFFATTFTDLSGQSRNDPEAQGIEGDSGGAVFRWTGGTSELLGILYARGSALSEQAGQPAGTALYGNVTFVADLDFYRTQILDVIDQPDCDDGIDEDADGLVDYPEDPGCTDPSDDDEQDKTLVCDNGLDDDLDGLFDFPDDDGCLDSLDTSEVPEPGFSVAMAIGTCGLALASRRRIRAIC